MRGVFAVPVRLHQLDDVGEAVAVDVVGGFGARPRAGQALPVGGAAVGVGLHSEGS